MSLWHLPRHPPRRVRSHRASAPAGWARSIGPLTRTWIATSPSRSSPPQFAADAERIARFQREAKVLASLNHPNIAAIYGLERSGGHHALVMELVEGEDLSQRIARGAIPLDEALPIAKQIAEALEAAHEQGSSIVISSPRISRCGRDGTVKVLDFGLAKAMEPAGAMSAERVDVTDDHDAGHDAGRDDPGHRRLHVAGTGTRQDGRQARRHLGVRLRAVRDVDGQSGIPGEDITDTLAAVVRSEPDWSLVPRNVSPTLLVFLRRSLQKDPKQRIPDIATCAWRWRARLRRPLRRRRRRPRHRRRADGWPGWRLPSHCLRPLRSPFPQCGICAKRHHPCRPRCASKSTHRPRQTLCR